MERRTRGELREEFDGLSEGDFRVVVHPETVPTTAAPYHPSATHTDALGMPVAFNSEGWPYHPTPCCGASASISDGPMYCKGCYHEVDPAYGNHPVEPYAAILR